MRRSCFNAFFYALSCSVGRTLHAYLAHRFQHEVQNRSLALRRLLPLSWKCTHVCCNEVHPHYLSHIISAYSLHRALAAAGHIA